MKNETNEMLMAYVDGELDEESVRDVERLLMEKEDLREQVEIYRQSALWLKTHMSEVEQLPVPDRFRLADSQSVERVSGSSKVSWINRYRNSVESNPHWITSHALAASVTLLVGILVGMLISEKDPRSVDYQSSQFLFDTLESGVSGIATKSDNDNLVITPLATFVVDDGGFCREYEATFDKTLTTGIACRSTSNQWSNLVEVHESLTVGVQGDQYVPASGSEDLISNYLDSINAGPAMNIIEEGRLIDRRWKN